ncbi:MAG TPA: SAM-dependent chlorinase/fluorinase [Acidimicrobiales bacterium]|nr:SAM-dependent chlorinase/fluorinase [Acidimicrobiales bacterium]
MTNGQGGAVFLLTDYGDQDEFAGVTRAVVLRQAPRATLVDLTHAIPPFDVRAGALTLSRSVAHLGPGVVIAVVDPGVGSDRRAVALTVSGDSGPRHLVGPDNGLLCWAADVLGGVTAAVVLTPPTPTPPTPTGTGGPRVSPSRGRGSFDGRDLFAPVAARLWLGASLLDVGLPVDPGSLVRLAPPRREVSAGTIETEVLWVDRFGNVQLAARAEDAVEAGLGEVVAIGIGGTGTEGSGTGGRTRVGRRVGWFGALGRDEVGLLVDANGQLALVCHRRPAATVLGVRAGEMIRLGSTGS